MASDTQAARREVRDQLQEIVNDAEGDELEVWTEILMELDETIAANEPYPGIEDLT